MASVYVVFSSWFLNAKKYGESGLLRFMKSLLVLVTVLSLIIAFFLVPGMLACVLSTYYMGAAIGCWALLVFGSNSRLVQNLYFMHDTILGLFSLSMILVFAGLYVPGKIQTWLLYNNALSRGVVIEDILRASSRNEDREDELSLHQMRSIIMEQQRVISALAGNGTDSDSSLAQAHGDLVHTMSDNALSAMRNMSESDLAAIYDASKRLTAIVHEPEQAKRSDIHSEPPIRRSMSTLNDQMRSAVDSP